MEWIANSGSNIDPLVQYSQSLQPWGGSWLNIFSHQDLDSRPPPPRNILMPAPDLSLSNRDSRRWLWLMNCFPAPAANNFSCLQNLRKTHRVVTGECLWKATNHSTVFRSRDLHWPITGQCPGHVVSGECSIGAGAKDAQKSWLGGGGRWEIWGGDGCNARRWGGGIAEVWLQRTEAAQG